MTASLDYQIPVSEIASFGQASIHEPQPLQRYESIITFSFMEMACCAQMSTQTPQIAHLRWSTTATDGEGLLSSSGPFAGWTFSVFSLVICFPAVPVHLVFPVISLRFSNA